MPSSVRSLGPTFNSLFGIRCGFISSLPQNALSFNSLFGIHKHRHSLCRDRRQLSTPFSGFSAAFLAASKFMAFNSLFGIRISQFPPPLHRGAFNSLFGILGRRRRVPPLIVVRLSTPFSGFETLVLSHGSMQTSTFNSLFGILLQRKYQSS